VIDPDNWDPLSVDDAAEIFRRIGVQWWIAGGWALDLYLGNNGREHIDTDVLVLRNDQLFIQERLSDWKLFKTKQPGLAPWPNGEYLCKPVNSIWARRGDDLPWSFEIMLMDTEQDNWVYRRLPSIRGRIKEMGLNTDSGIPYLAPEIQLLYKSGSDRDKDRFDLDRTLPHLPADRIEWLLDCLRQQYPPGHEWVCRVKHWSKKT
jgi:hypothetical protein